MTYPEPVTPTGMAMLFIYICPYCQNQVALMAPTSPVTVTCNDCHNNFPIVPVEERTMQYLQTMLADGKAAGNPVYC